jgi:hypothetical protein
MFNHQYCRKKKERKKEAKIGHTETIQQIVEINSNIILIRIDSVLKKSLLQRLIKQI